MDRYVMKYNELMHKRELAVGKTWRNCNCWNCDKLRTRKRLLDDGVYPELICSVSGGSSWLGLVGVVNKDDK